MWYCLTWRSVCLSKHKALYSIPINCINWVWEYMPILPTLGKWRKENQMFKVIFEYIVSLRPIWATRDLRER